jgi:hypothetical protein
MRGGVSTTDVLEGTRSEAVVTVGSGECTKSIHGAGIEDSGVLDILVVWGKTCGSAIQLATILYLIPRFLLEKVLSISRGLLLTARGIITSSSREYNQCSRNPFEEWSQRCEGSDGATRRIGR